MSRLRIALWGVAAAAALGGAVSVLATSPREQGVTSVLAALAATSFLFTGIVARARRPTNRTGALLMATGFLWCLGGLTESGNGWVYAIGSATNALAFGPFSELMLTFPSGQTSRRRHVWLIGSVWALLVLPIPALLLLARDLDPECRTCPDNPMATWPHQSVAEAIGAVMTLAAVGLIAWMLVEIVLRYRGSSRPLRRTMWPVLLASGGALTMLALGSLIAIADGGIGDAVGKSFIGFFALVPLAFLAGVLKSRLARGSVAEMVVAIGSGHPLRKAIAETIGDPSLEIGYWLPDRSRYVTSEGGSLRIGGRATTAVERDGRPIALLAHDPVLADEHELLRGVAAAAALSLETERLQAELRAQLAERERQAEELRASRNRIVQAADDARRVLERNLHDGAQQRLVALALSLRLAEGRVVSEPDRARAMIAAAREELSQALDELRELARGIHPAVLTDRGLGPAVEALAARSPVPVELDLPTVRLPAPVEAAAYYVVAEGLTNVARYARATAARVSIRVEDGAAKVDVRDDGVGGASVDGGTGLRGLVDRLAALDGTLAVGDAGGRGTALHAEIPLAREAVLEGAR